MSTPITEAHRKLATDLCRNATGSNRALHHVPKFAQLIADSEARAVVEIAMVAAESADRNVSLRLERDELRGALALRQENFYEVYDELRADCDAARADVVWLTAERDQLRAENATLRAAQKACEACDEPTAFEVRQLRARAERAEAELAAERARLDYLLKWDVTFNSRENIDRDMKEGAK